MRTHQRVLKKLLISLGPVDSRFAMVEIGVWRGQTSQSILRRFPNLHLTMVDPWAENRPWHTVIGALPQVDKAMQVKYSRQARRFRTEALRRTRPYRSRTTIIRKKSVDAALDCPEFRYDLVFIDGNHSYGGVMLDLMWACKVKKGGILCGHDYGGKFDGVAQAVDEWAQSHDKKVTIGKSMMWWTKM